jgi:hypothetical protein
VYEALVIALAGGIFAARAWLASTGSISESAVKGSKEAADWTGLDRLGIRVDLSLLLGLGSVFVMLFILLQEEQSSLSRVVAPFVLLGLMLMLATRQHHWLVGGILAINLLCGSSFLTHYQDWRANNFVYDYAKLERFRQVAEASLHFDPAQNPWCNSLLVPHYPPEVIVVPPGIGLGVVWGVARLQPPLKTHYLLLDPEWLGHLGGLVRLQEIAQTEVGTIYRNIDAGCP